MAKTVKCRYKYCSHEIKDIPKENAIKVGNSYYHSDCYKESQEKKQVADLFFKHCNKDSPPPQLWRTINDIVHKKGVSSELLLYGINYYIRNNIPLNYPPGLYYVVANKEMNSEYAKHKFSKQKIEFRTSGEIGTKFNYKKKKKTLNDLLEG